MGRKLKDSEPRKVYSVRLTPDAYAILSQTADMLNVSVSDLIQNYASSFCKTRILFGFRPVIW